MRASRRAPNASAPRFARDAIFCTLDVLRNGMDRCRRRTTPPFRPGPWAVPLLASALLALKFAHVVPADAAYVLTLAGLLLGATVFAAVHHAEVLALKLGEPFGSILLAVAVTVIEAGLIVSIMLCRRRGRRARRARHGVRGGDDRSQWRRRPLPRPRGGQALRADLPTAGRGLRARRARDAGDAGADPAQFRRGAPVRPIPSCSWRASA